MGQAITASPAGDGWPPASRAAPSVSITSTSSSTTRLASRPIAVVPIASLLRQRGTRSSQRLHRTLEVGKKHGDLPALAFGRPKQRHDPVAHHLVHGALIAMHGENLPRLLDRKSTRLNSS